MAFRDHRLSKKILVQAEIQYQDHPSGGWVTAETVTDRDKVAERLEFHQATYGVQRWRALKIFKDNPDYGRFTKGTRVKVHPATDAFMEGLKFGIVVAVNPVANTLRVAWSLNEKITRRIPVAYLEPMDETEGE